MMARMSLSSGPVLSRYCARNGENCPPQRFAQFRPSLDDFLQIRAGRGNWCAYRCVRFCVPQANCRFSQVQVLYRAPSFALPPSPRLRRTGRMAGHPATCDVNRDRGTASANGGWLRRLVSQHHHRLVNPFQNRSSCIAFIKPSPNSF